MTTKYHIDTTQEEDLLFTEDSVTSGQPNQPPQTKKLFAKIFGVVLLLHVAVVSAIFLTTNISSAAQSQSSGNSTTSVPPCEPTSSVTEPVKETISTPKVEQTMTSSLPDPTPPPLTASKNVPQIKPLTKKEEVVPTKNSSYTKDYTVKKGDTISSIAKKYKLNKQQLLKINKITEPNKIKEGQVLQFLAK